MKHWKPYILFNDRFLDLISWTMRVGGISLFPFVILRTSYRRSRNIQTLTKAVTHETIHFQQALELLIIPFYLLYLLEFLCKLPFYGSDAYLNISFEREAYQHHDDPQYLEYRKRYNWLLLIF